MFFKRPIEQSPLFRSVHVRKHVGARPLNVTRDLLPSIHFLSAEVSQLLTSVACKKYNGLFLTSLSMAQFMVKIESWQPNAQTCKRYASYELQQSGLHWLLGGGGGGPHTNPADRV